MKLQKSWKYIWLAAFISVLFETKIQIILKQTENMKNIKNLIVDGFLIC